MIGILVVDDHEAVRLGIAELFTGTEDFTVVGTAADGAEVVAAAEQLRPDVVLMDVSMPGMDGISATRALLAIQPQIRVVMLSCSAPAPAVHRARAAGVSGYQLKSTDPTELLDAVRVVAAGGKAWCRQAVEVLRHAL